MHLEKIEVKGFKSFKDKVTIEFPDKFTIIVGPNGSGKSNLTEAICFVLGKSRGLRATNMAELIFNGGVNNAPAKKAVVAVTFRADDGRKKKISRMVDELGHSIYTIDGKRSTRQQVVEIVGENEYNILLQDDVTRVIEMTPRERRGIIDDLCGIAEYDKKKARALKELEKVEDHISDTHIRLGEKQGYLVELGKERKEALAYQETRDRLEQARASILGYEISRLEASSSSMDEKKDKLDAEKIGSYESLALVKKTIEESNMRLRELNNHVLKLEEERGGGRVYELKAHTTRCADQINLIREKRGEVARDLDSRKLRRKAFEKELEDLSSRLESINAELEKLAAEIVVESGKVGDEGLDAQINRATDEVYGLQSEANTLEKINESLAGEVEDLEVERKGLEDRVKELKDERRELDAQLSENEGKHSVTSMKTRNLGEKRNELIGRLEKNQDRLTELNKDLARKQAELKALEQASGGVNKAVNSVLKLKDVIPGIHGTVSQLGKVEDEEYEIAIEVAAGNRLHSIVVDNVDVAAKCIKYLREKKVGRATFLPLDKLNVKVSNMLPPNAIGFAREFVKYSKKYDNVFGYVFGDTLLVKDISTAKAVGIGKYRMVSVDGDLFEMSGALTGGHKRKTGNLGFSSLDALEEDIRRIESQLIALQGEHEGILQDKIALDTEIARVDEIVRNSTRAVDRIRVETSTFDDREKDLRKSLEKVVSRLEELGKTIQENSVKGKSTTLQAKESQRKLDELIEARGDADESRLIKLKDKARDLEVEQGRLQEKTGSNNRQVTELAKEIKALASEDTNLEKELTDKEAEHAQAKTELAAAEEDMKNLSDEIRQMLEEKQDIEEKMTAHGADLGSLERKLLEITDELSRINVRKAEINTHLVDLRNNFRRYEGVELLDGRIRELEEMRDSLEVKLEEFGTVNLRAIETYDMIKKEFDDTMEKLDTLKSERQSIFDFMEEVEQKKRETFMKTFEVVKDNFEKIFNQISEGYGTLILDNPKNISDSGLLINAAPGKKKLVSLDAMSGGEKVLTSSAFLLAIQQYKPSFFYVVDELDAALDKTNSSKLGEMLKNSKTQFILVSHNDEMIKYGESVVGVSMTDGVSQIVGVRIT